MDLGGRRGYPACMPAQRPSKPVLLIDDNEDVRVSMKTLLELDGYSVVAASEGEDALTKLRGGLEPCVILLDMLMPGKDGLQFRAEQLDDPELATIPTIAYSANPGLESKAVLLGLPFIKKPDLPGSVLDVVERYSRRD
jgi:CheY-like chemotaxis protein